MTGEEGARRGWSRGEVLLLVLALLPPAFLLRTILRLGVDTPYMDQWETASLFAKRHEGTLSFADLWAQQNESRMPIPRLVFLGLGLLTGWNVVAETIPAFALACFGLWAFYRVGRGGGEGPRAVALARILLPSFLLFGPIQYENWLWGHQLAVFVPPACLLAGILVARSRLGPRARWCAAGGLASAATFSFANGLLLWLLLPFALLEGDEAPPAERRRRVAIWTACAAAAAALFLAGWEKPAAQPGFLEAVRRPLDAARYLVVLLGSPLGQGYGHTGIGASAILGTATLLAFATCAAFALRPERGLEIRRRALPWLLLGGYALGTALITTAGRAGFGVPHALSPRYATFAVLLLIAAIRLAGSLREVAVLHGVLGLTESRAAAIVGAAISVIAHAHFETSSTALVRMENWRVRRLEARACLAFVQAAPNEPFLAVNAYPDVAALRERAAAVDRLGLLRPAIVKPDALPALLAGAADPAAGSFHVANAMGGILRCAGTATLRDRAEPPDGILVGWVDDAGAPRLLAVAQATKIRLSSKEPPSADFRRTTDWECRIPLESVPSGAKTLRAWAYDTETGRAVPLVGTPAAPSR